MWYRRFFGNSVDRTSISFYMKTELTERIEEAMRFPRSRFVSTWGRRGKQLDIFVPLLDTTRNLDRLNSHPGPNLSVGREAKNFFVSANDLLASQGHAFLSRSDVVASIFLLCIAPITRRRTLGESCPPRSIHAFPTRPDENRGEVAVCVTPRPCCGLGTVAWRPRSAAR